jgi:2,4-diketo-3-deoxy-L-fuconate hydrolase
LRWRYSEWELKMKLIRVGPKGDEKPGVLITEAGIQQRLDCSAYFSDWNHDFFRDDGLAQLAQLLRDKREQLPVFANDLRLGTSIARPGKILCIGLNYRDHAIEAKLQIPKEPLVFMKAANSINGPCDPIHIPRGAEKTDWEVELAIVLGAEARYLSDNESGEACIAGYCLANDVSERAFQIEHEGQWVKGKSCDTFCPLGPWLVTRDELADTSNLAMQLAVNGVTKQNSNTNQMIFSPAEIVRYLSGFMTLEPGDVILTGTPPGVGMGQNPPQFLSAGDQVELSIDGLGKQTTICVDAK